ncbi:YHS domain-containing (seleno)protein [Magnetospira sp. QH-2]|uniref:YHS domain-containing (seleno)protein n=1 Tax=Magnetospira sp. (strain QH-2) TaxID=1288970 RepID=UPI0003E81568
MSHVRFILLALIILLGQANAAMAGEIHTSNGVAIDGYDPVAYYTEGRPMEGAKDFTWEWKGADWRFASAENRDLFKADPEKYAPQYGGYCAWAVSHGYTAGTDPDAWMIVEGKLYLNYSPHVQRRWKVEKENNISNADQNWIMLQARLKN